MLFTGQAHFNQHFKDLWPVLTACKGHGNEFKTKSCSPPHVPSIVEMPEPSTEQAGHWCAGVKCPSCWGNSGPTLLGAFSLCLWLSLLCTLPSRVASILHVAFFLKVRPGRASPLHHILSCPPGHSSTPFKDLATEPLWWAQ